MTMTRDIRIYLLAVALPAVLLVVLGIRLVSLESALARSSMVDNLNARAGEIRRAILEEMKTCGCAPAAHMPHPPGRGMHQAGPPHPPPPPHRFHWWRKKQVECRNHDIPAELRQAVEKAVRESPSGERPCLAELRHSCGAVVVGGAEGISGSITGEAPLGPPFIGYSIVVSPVGGDREVALGIRAQAALAAILLALLFASLSAAFVLLARSARRERDEARRQTDFLANVSHELKTPLTSITMFSEMLSSGALADEARDKALSSIVRESKRLARQIESLLDYARLSRGARKFEISDFDLANVAADAAAAFAPSFPDGLRIEAPPQLLVKGDREAARRILDALLENAAKYAAASGEVVIRVTAPGSVSVEDSGPGLSPEDSRHVFERFWRADRSITRTTGGAGMGLAIASELAQGMGAVLSVEPNSPSGCIFKLRFPSADREV